MKGSATLVLSLAFLAWQSDAFSPLPRTSLNPSGQPSIPAFRNWPRHHALSLTTRDTTPLPDDRVVQAVENVYGARVTAADTAAAAGVSLEEAKVGLTRLSSVLASQEGTALEVDENGEIAYSFPTDVRKALRKVSRRARWRARWRDKIKPVASKVGKTMFGVGLVVNVAAVWTMLAAISSSQQNEEDRRPAFHFHISPFDLLYMLQWSDNSRYYDRVLRGEAPPEMNSLESIYSFVFGDGDPNARMGEAELAAAAAAIRRAGGVVAAEEIAPYVLSSPPPVPVDEQVFDDGLQGIGEDLIVDEQWLLPIVTALGGVPEVTEDGDIVYVFDDVLSTAESEGGDQPLANFLRSRAGAGTGSSGASALQETEVPFSRAPQGALMFAAGLGAADLVGVLMLGAALDARGLMPTFSKVFWPLFLYAVGINVTPLVRNARRVSANAKIAERNQRRLGWRRRLSEAERQALAPAKGSSSSALVATGDSSSSLARKIRGARDAVKRKRLAFRRFGRGEDGKDSVLFNSSEDVIGSAVDIAAKEGELSDFDKRLQESK